MRHRGENIVRYARDGITVGRLTYDVVQRKDRIAARLVYHCDWDASHYVKVMLDN